MLARHVIFPNVHVHTVLRSICQRWPSSTSRPSHTHRCLTHSHPSRYCTRDCRSAFCRIKSKKTLTSLYVTWHSFFYHGKSYFKCNMYLSFDHVQHKSQLLQSLLQLLQPVIFLFLRNRLSPLRRSWGAQHHSSLQLVTLDILRIMVGFVLWPLASLRFTWGWILLEYSTTVSLRIWAMGVRVLRRRQSIWKEKAAVDGKRDSWIVLEWIEEEIWIPNKHPGKMPSKLRPTLRNNKQTVGWDFLPEGQKIWSNAHKPWWSHYSVLTHWVSHCLGF